MIYGAEGARRPPLQQFKGGNARLPAGAGRYGYTIVARDLDDDGYGDLVVGAPGDATGSREAARCTSSTAGGRACARTARG